MSKIKELAKMIRGVAIWPEETVAKAIEEAIDERVAFFLNLEKVVAVSQQYFDVIKKVDKEHVGWTPENIAAYVRWGDRKAPSKYDICKTVQEIRKAKP